MQVVLKRNARREGFLHASHPWPVRMAMGCLGAVGAVAATGNPRLGVDLFRQFYRHDDFMLGIRRASWYARRGWLGLNLSRDPVYVFCRGMDTRELDAVRAFLLRRGPRGDPGLQAADLAYVSAMQAIRTVGTSAFAEALDRFAQDADRMLAAIAEPPLHHSTPAPETEPGRAFPASRAQAALRDMADLLDRHGVRWFVLSGTFLGLVREGGFLPHDDDIDLGVMADDTDVPRLQRLIRESPSFRAGSIELQTSFERDAKGRLGVRERPVFLTAGHKQGVKLDIFVHYREGDTIWHGSSLFRWDNSTFSLARYELAGVPVLGPADADRYLTENYGEWRIPVTIFNSATDTTNQHPVRNPLSVAIFLRRAWISSRANAGESAAILRLLTRDGLLQLAPDRAGGLRLNRSAFSP